MPAATAGSRPRTSRGGSTRTQHSDGPSFGGRAPREPKWAKGLSLEEIEAEKQARKLPTDVDPSTIDDEAVRDRYTARLHRIEAGEERDPAGSVVGKTGNVQPAIRVTRSAVGGAGRLVAGVIVYAAAINYVRGGWSGLSRWFFAKLTNNHGTLP